MREIELKFQIPPAARPGVRRSVATATASAVRLQARYFDTPDRRLAAAGVALRLRKEGAAWVQTLKTRGDGVMERGEHEVPLARTRDAPVLDVSRHADTPAGAALAAALDGAELDEIFATDIRRTRRIARVAGAVIEIALDEGEIRCGTQRRPVCEIEFELVRGSPSALPAFAATWVQRHGLWLDPRSKAEFGDRLARGIDSAAPVKAKPPPLRAGMPGRDAFRALVAGALDQVLRNACELADGSTDPEHLHQCRVGMRRLRCALRDFASLAGAAAPPQAQGWQEQIAAVFRRLGGARDRDALRESLLPRLVAAGAPITDLPPPTASEEEPGAVLREPSVNRLWLELLATVHARDDAAPQQEQPLHEQLRAILRKLHKRVARDAQAFAALDEARQHRTRKRLKRLRYGAEFCASLYEDKAVAQYLDALRPAQDALGEANDLVVARSMFEAQLAHDPRAWFALGWLAGRRPVVIARCAKALGRIAQARGFWRHAPP